MWSATSSQLQRTASPAAFQQLLEQERGQEDEDEEQKEGEGGRGPGEVHAVKVVDGRRGQVVV